MSTNTDESSVVYDMLSPRVTVQENDILSGKGRMYASHPGNANFDRIIERFAKRYGTSGVSVSTIRETIEEETQGQSPVACPPLHMLSFHK